MRDSFIANARRGAIARRWTRIAAAAAFIAASTPALAQSDAARRGGASAGDTSVSTARASWVVGYESLDLPGDESMGLLGARYLVEFAPGWSIGPALYGAADGRRGGLFTWGAEARRLWQPLPGWRVGAGFYVGGGGGADAPDGGGLMLRPQVELLRDFGAWSLGVSASSVRFPSGEIRSSQLGLVVELRDDFTYAAPGRVGRSTAGESADTRVSATVGRYRWRDGSGTTLGYVGARLDRPLGDIVSVTFEGHGAATGSADGYAEFGAGLAADWPSRRAPASVGVRATVGLGGGGAVPTGGGLLARASVGGRLALSPGVAVGVEAGRATAPDGAFDASYGQVLLSMSLNSPGAAPGRRTVDEFEWGVGLQRYTGAQRRDGSERALDAIALKFNRKITDQIYLTGQAISAIAGGAGAYSAGLVGVGWTAPVGSRFHVGAEAAVGAAGGGGVASRGGAMVQPMAYVGWNVDRHNRVRFGAGAIESRRGELSSPVVDLTWVVALGL